MTSSRNIKHTFRKNLYQLLPKKLLYKQVDKPNIFLFSSRRGGGTYLSELISVEKGIRFIDQPFDLFKSNTEAGKIRAHYLPFPGGSQFIHLNEDQEKTVRSYIYLLFKGGLKQLSSPCFYCQNRTLLKIVNALPLFDWLNQQFEVMNIYLIRHPLAQSLSVVKNGWGITAQAYLENSYFCQNYLSPKQIRKGSLILGQGSYLEKAVLNWICENLVPLKFSHQKDLILTYEELVLQPELMIPLIADHLDLKNVERMKKRINYPSAATEFSTEKTIHAICQDNREYLVNKWVLEVDEPEREKVQELLDAFGIHDYGVGKSLAVDELLHFSNN